MSRFPRPGPTGRRSPCSKVISRHYDFLRSVSLCFVFLRSAIPHLYPVRSGKLDTMLAGLEIWVNRFSVAVVDVEMTGSPKFLGDPNVPFAHAQATPVSRLNPDRDVRKRRFRFSAWPLQGETQRRSHGKTFEAQSHRFRTRCLRFAVIVTDHHARLASGRWSNPTRRDSRPLGHYQRFLISIHIVIILLRQASWRNPLFVPTRNSLE